VLALGREAYPEAVRCLLRFRHAKGSWAQMVILSNARTLLPEPFLHWGLRTTDLGVSEPKDEGAIRELCLMYLHGEPDAVVTSLEAGLGSRWFEPKHYLHLVLGPLRRLDDPATAALLGRLLGVPGVDAAGKTQVLAALARKTNPAAKQTLDAVARSSDPDVAARARLLVEAMRARVRGAFVLTVVPASAAARSGLRPGDVITSFAGQTIDARERLRRANVKTEGQVPVEVVRGGRKLTLRYDSSSWLSIESVFLDPR